MNKHIDEATKIVDKVRPNLFGQARTAYIRIAAEALGNNLGEAEIAYGLDPGAALSLQKQAHALVETTIQRKNLNISPEQRGVLVDEFAAGLIKQRITGRAASVEQARRLAAHELRDPAGRQLAKESPGIGIER